MSKNKTYICSVTNKVVKNIDKCLGCIRFVIKKAKHNQ